MVLKNLVKTQNVVSLDEIYLDLQNPRYNDKLAQINKTKWDEELIEQTILKSGLKDIFESIKNHGVLDPIWLIKTSRNEYHVVEGSRRVVCLRQLNDDETITPPKGIRYDQVIANIIPASTTVRDIDALRVLLQTGKKGWGPYNVAFVIDKLLKEGFNTKETAKMMGKTKGFVDKASSSFGLFKEYVDYLKHKGIKKDPKKFTYFQRAGDAVKKRFFSSQRGRNEFFGLITPHGKSKARIPSVALKGGLYHFNKIAEDEQILNRFLNDPDMTVEDAMVMYIGKYVTAEFPWAKKIVDLSLKVENLDPDTIQRFKHDRKIIPDVKVVYKFLKKILEK